MEPQITQMAQIFLIGITGSAEFTYQPTKESNSTLSMTLAKAVEFHGINTFGYGKIIKQARG